MTAQTYTRKEIEYAIWWYCYNCHISHHITKKTIFDYLKRAKIGLKNKKLNPEGIEVN